MPPVTTTLAAPGPATAPADWRTVRCENDRCRHIVFRYLRDALPSGGVVIEVKCSCNTVNRVRLTPRERRVA